jgi:carbamoyltransferase
MNAAIIRSGLFKKVFIQPAAADDGSSLGAALYVFHDVLQNKNRMPIQHVFWGPKFDSDDIRSVLRENLRICWRKENNIEEAAARLLAEGKTLGWFQGHMEMGPRALGARSILADPRSLELRNRLNIQIKNREFFQPFAPSVLSEYASKYFDISDSVSSPYMLVTFLTLDHQKDAIPGVVHVDGTARLQTVSENDNPRFYRLLKKFYEYTDTPVLLNTSFNRAGEPIVNTPEDALHCFIQSGLDALVMEDYLILPENAND